MRRLLCFVLGHKWVKVWWGGRHNIAAHHECKRCNARREVGR